jgi:hypothetical protein
MLQNFLTPELSPHGTDLSTIWFQQDGASAHTATASMQVIQEMFPDHVMSLAVSIHGLHIHLISLPVIISLGVLQSGSVHH